VGTVLFGSNHLDAVLRGRAGTGVWIATAVSYVVPLPYPMRTTATAFLVGTVYFAVNQFGTVLRGGATTSVWIACGFSYLVPFCVSNAGLLIGCRRRS
jgi:hypothetical protein